MWDAEITPMPDGARRYELHHAGAPLSYGAAIELWQRDAVFRELFLDALRNAPAAAYFWETPPVTRAALDRRFEFVLTPSDELAGIAPEREPFAARFDLAAGAAVSAFPNLSGDALLVVPCPLAQDAVYAHLAAFVRSAPSAQAHALWQQTGAALEARLANAPIWLSTAGLGVSWLHLRFDSTPKYYRHEPYKLP